MKQAKLVFIGGGNMGEAMLRGVLRAHVMPAEAVAVVEPVEARRLHLADALGVDCIESLPDAPPAAAYVLAVKPQQMSAVLPALAKTLGDRGALVVSIAAGVSTARLSESLGSRARLVRAMPNTPMLVGCGCTGLCGGPGANEDDIAFARTLFSAGGEVAVVDEPAMDVVTAVSGSGPAYFFYLIEAMVNAAIAEGLNDATALLLATQTCAGAARLLAQTGDMPNELRRRVTSPGGTTQAAIETLDGAGVKDAMVAAVRAAAARSRELGT